MPEIPSKWSTTAQLREVTKKSSLPHDPAVSVTPGAPVYRGVGTAITIAGVEVILMARNASELLIAYNKITNFGAYSAGKTHEIAVMSRSQVSVDDEL